MSKKVSTPTRQAASLRDERELTPKAFDRRLRKSAPGRVQEELQPVEEYYKSWSVNHSGRGAGELRAPSDVRYLPDPDKLAVADSGNHRIQIYIGEASAVKLYDRSSTPCLNHPTTLALSKDLHTIAADGDKLHVIDDKGKCITHWQPVLPNKEDRKVIRGMAVDAEDNFIISNFGAKPTVELYNHDTCKLMRTLQVKQGFKSPRYITCNKRNGLIYVSDYEQGAIHMFDKRAKRCLHTIERGEAGSSSRLVCPHGMCVADNGMLYVADKAQNTVSQFLTDTFYRHVLTEAEGLNDPIAISVSDKHQIAVVSCTLDVKRDHYAVEVFQEQTL